MKIPKITKILTFLLFFAVFTIYMAGCSDNVTTPDNQTDDQYIQEVVLQGVRKRTAG